MVKPVNMKIRASLLLLIVRLFLNKFSVHFFVYYFNVVFVICSLLGDIHSDLKLAYVIDRKSETSVNSSACFSFFFKLKPEDDATTLFIKYYLLNNGIPGIGDAPAIVHTK